MHAGKLSVSHHSTVKHGVCKGTDMSAVAIPLHGNHTCGHSLVTLTLMTWHSCPSHAQMQDKPHAWINKWSHYFIFKRSLMEGAGTDSSESDALEECC